MANNQNKNNRGKAYIGKSGSKNNSGYSNKNSSKKPEKFDIPGEETLIDEKRNLNERRGVWCIAIGLVIGIVSYFNVNAVFIEKINELLGGLFGIFSYILPIGLIALGVYLIYGRKRAFTRAEITLIVTGIILFVIGIQIIGSPDIKDVEYGKYIGETFKNRTSGGAVSAVLAYPLIALLSAPGTLIMIIASEVVIIVKYTGISIAETSKKVHENISNSEVIANVKEKIEYRREERKREKLFVDEIDRDSKRDDYDINLINDDIEDEKQRAKRKKEKKKSRIPMDEFTMDFSDSEEKYEQSYNKSNDSFDVKNDGKELEIDYFDESDYQGDDDDFDYEDVIISGYEDNNINNENEDYPIIYDDFNIVKTENEQEKKTDSVNTANIDDIIVESKSIVNAEYQRPPIDCLTKPKVFISKQNESPKEKGELLIKTLASFNISAKVINISVGPTVTRFEIIPAQGIRVSKITSLSNDIALALAAPLVRIEAPIPGKAAIGIEVPNENTTMVTLREVVESNEFKNAKSPITFALGRDIAGKILIGDLHKMPHLLIAGTTGSGKSVCINDIIVSMIYKSTPDDLRLILIDPKVVEMQIYESLPHLLEHVVTDPKKAAGVLRWAVHEMGERYNKMSLRNVRELARYNALQENKEDKLPKIVIIIDELAELMMEAAKDVEESICRIAQLGRAAGIHLIVATQRPSTDVITGLIKANIPSKIAFMVSKAVDSRVILDASGAEKLLGKGDMLFYENGAQKIVRAQAAFVSDEEIESIMDFFKDNNITPEMNEQIKEFKSTAQGTQLAQGEGKQEDELLPDAVRVVMENNTASISMIQRRLRVGYARAARLIDIMEQKKFISGYDGSKPRNVLITPEQFNNIFGNGDIDE